MQGRLPFSKGFKRIITLSPNYRRGNEPTPFAPPRRSGGGGGSRRVVENAAEGSEEEGDTRDGNLNGTKTSD